MQERLAVCRIVLLPAPQQQVVIPESQKLEIFSTGSYLLLQRIVSKTTQQHRRQEANMNKINRSAGVLLCALQMCGAELVISLYGE